MCPGRQQRSKTSELALGDGTGACSDQISKCIGCVVAADAFFIGVDFEDVFGPVGVMLEVRECFCQAGAALVDEQFWGNACVWVAELLEDFGPAVNAVGVGRA